MHPTYLGPFFSFTTLTLLKSEMEPMIFFFSFIIDDL